MTCPGLNVQYNVLSDPCHLHMCEMFLLLQWSCRGKQVCSVPTACRFITTEDKILSMYVDGTSLTCAVVRSAGSQHVHEPASPRWMVVLSVCFCRYLQAGMYLCISCQLHSLKEIATGKRTETQRLSSWPTPTMAYIMTSATLFSSAQDPNVRSSKHLLNRSQLGCPSLHNTYQVLSAGCPWQWRTSV